MEDRKCLLNRGGVVVKGAMRIFCTIFDKNYLYQGVALYNSLNRVAGDFKLYALCMDAIAYTTIKKLKLDNLFPISVDELMNAEAFEVRGRTTHGQFCWVCQPLICQFILDKFNAAMVTYLDADSLFFSNPEVLFEEMGEKSVSLSPHNYSPEFDKGATSGRFCTQFNAFRNNQAGREVLKDWKALCFLYDKNSPHFYPGQFLLNDWPEKFDCVKIIEHPGAGVAPWNIQRYNLGLEGSVPQVDGFPVVFYHFHGYGRYKNGDHELGAYPFPKEVINSIYKKYVNEIRTAEMIVHSVDSEFNFRREYEPDITLMDAIHSPSLQNFREYIRVIKRKIHGRYNVFSDGYFS